MTWGGTDRGKEAMRCRSWELSSGSEMPRFTARIVRDAGLVRPEQRRKGVLWCDGIPTKSIVRFLISLTTPRSIVLPYFVSTRGPDSAAAVLPRPTRLFCMRLSCSVHDRSDYCHSMRCRVEEFASTDDSLGPSACSLVYEGLTFSTQ